MLIDNDEFATPSESSTSPAPSSNTGDEEISYCKRITEKDYEYNRTVHTYREVHKLKQTIEYTNFQSNPSIKVNIADRWWSNWPKLSLTVIGIIIALSHQLGRAIIKESITTQQLTSQVPETISRNTSKVITEPTRSRPRLWARPVTERALAMENIEVTVPKINMDVKAVPVGESCSGRSSSGIWVPTTNSTQLSVPVAIAGPNRLCLRDNEEIIDQSSTVFTVCGITRVNTPTHLSAGKDFTLLVSGHCMSGIPLLSIIPDNQTPCSEGRQIRGISTLDEDWEFAVYESKGAATQSCILLSEGWFMLPRFVVQGATSYSLSTPYVTSKNVHLVVSGVDMQPDPRILLVNRNTSCKLVSGEGLPATSESPYQASFEIDFTQFKNSISPIPKRTSTVGPELNVCIGWKGEYMQVGDPFQLKNDVYYFLVYMVLAGIILIAIIDYKSFLIRRGRDSPNNCSICMIKSCTTAFSCGHVCTCTDCSETVRVCPICRVRISKRLKVFFP